MSGKRSKIGGKFGVSSPPYYRLLLIRFCVRLCVYLKKVTKQENPKMSECFLNLHWFHLFCPIMQCTQEIQELLTAAKHSVSDAITDGGETAPGTTHYRFNLKYFPSLLFFAKLNWQCCSKVTV